MRPHVLCACMGWLPIKSNDTVMCQFRSSRKQTPERRSASDILGGRLWKIKRRRSRTRKSSDCDTGVPPVKSEVQRKRILMESLRPQCHSEQVALVSQPHGASQRAQPWCELWGSKFSLRFSERRSKLCTSWAALIMLQGSEGSNSCLNRDSISACKWLSLIDYNLL